MAEQKRILVVLDDTDQQNKPNQPVIERAAWFAERFGAELDLFECVFDRDIDAGRFEHVWTPEPGARDQLVMQRRRDLDELAGPLRARGLRVNVCTAWASNDVEAVLRKVEADKPWLVAKATEHHSYIRRTLLTSGDWDLVRDCPAPLLLVNPRKLNARPHVLAAVDPLHDFDKPAVLDERILEFAAAIATAASGDLHVVHAYSTPPCAYVPPIVRQFIVDEHHAAMTRLLSNHSVSAENVHSFEGFPHDCLRQAVNEYDADFLVMGAVSRRGIDRWIIGSTAARMLDRVACDLVIIKPDRLVLPAGSVEARAERNREQIQPGGRRFGGGALRA